VTELSKDDARAETLRRWRALPETDRTSSEQAELFAAALADELAFRTMGNARRVILGWLTREMAGLPPWGNVPPESEVLRMKEAEMGETSDEKSQADEQAEDGTFLAEIFAIPPQTAAGLVARDGVPPEDVEQKVRESQQSGDEPTRDLVADNDEEEQLPRTKVQACRQRMSPAGAGR
jgi:hypothetical protein